MKELKIKGVKSAVGDFNRYEGHAEIMFDTETNKVWCDEFISCSDFKIYHSKSIETVLRKGFGNMRSNWNRTTMVEVKGLINSLQSKTTQVQ